MVLCAYRLIDYKMIYIYSKRYLIRLVVKSLFLFVGMHYTWLCYYRYASTNSHEKRLAVIWPNPHRNTATKWTARQSHRLNSSAVPNSCNTSVFILIAVISSPTNFERRSIIRSTWADIKDMDPEITNIMIEGSYTEENLVKTVFLLGQANKETHRSIETESEYYKDLVIGSFTDSYGNLTLKTRLGLKWAHQFCKFQYYLKTDDDVFVYSKGLVKWLWQLPRKRVYTGRCDFNKTVIRIPGHKWGVTKEDYQRDTFPSYCVGMGYILSSDVLHTMMAIVPQQPLFKLEDVYIGLILEKLKIEPVDRRRHLQVHSDYSWGVCQHKDMLLSLEANPKQMLQLYLKFSQLWKCGPVDYVK